MYVCEWAYWASFFFSCLLPYSSEKLVCAGRHGNNTCAVCALQGILSLSLSTAHLPPNLSLSPTPSSVFALPFTRRHLVPWGLTRQTQEMQIMLTAMLINAKTLDAWLTIANGPVGFVRKQLNPLHWCLIVRIHSLLPVSLYTDLTVNTNHISLLSSSWNLLV